MNPKVDTFIDKAQQWKKELKKLRMIILDCGLTEELKWGSPCYTYQGNNVTIIGELKTSCVLSFFKGALLNDPNDLLIKPGENTQGARIIPFASLAEIVQLEPVLKAYIYEAIEIEKAGLKVNFKAKNELSLPSELQTKFKKMPALKTAFHALTPGRQRAYILHFGAAKQSKTREARIEKYIQKILNGKGIME